MGEWKTQSLMPLTWPSCKGNIVIVKVDIIGLCGADVSVSVVARFNFWRGLILKLPVSKENH